MRSPFRIGKPSFRIRNSVIVETSWFVKNIHSHQPCISRPKSNDPNMKQGDFSPTEFDKKKRMLQNFFSVFSAGTGIGDLQAQEGICGTTVHWSSSAQQDTAILCEISTSSQPGLWLQLQPVVLSTEFSRFFRVIEKPPLRRNL